MYPSATVKITRKFLALLGHGVCDGASKQMNYCGGFRASIPPSTQLLWNLTFGKPCWHLTSLEKPYYVRTLMGFRSLGSGISYHIGLPDIVNRL